MHIEDVVRTLRYHVPGKRQHAYYYAALSGLFDLTNNAECTYERPTIQTSRATSRCVLGRKHTAFEEGQISD